MAQIIYTCEEREALDTRLPEKRYARELAVLLFESAWRAIRAGTATPDEFDDTLAGEMLAGVKALGAGQETEVGSRVRVKLTREEQQQVKERQAAGMDPESARLDTESEILLAQAEALAPSVASTRHRYPKKRYRRIKRHLAELRLSVGKDLTDDLEAVAFENRPENVCIHFSGSEEDSYLYDIEAASWHILESFEENDELNISYSKCGVRFLGDATEGHQMMRVYLVFHMACTEREDQSVCPECLPEMKHPPRMGLNPKTEMADA